MRSIAALAASASLATLTLAAGCGPGDDCEVTLTCEPPNTTGGSGGGGAAGGSGGASAGGGGSTAELGEACTDADGCASGFCIDGVCCDSACDATCMACNVADLEGTCTNAPIDSPDPDCGLATCDGIGACAYGEHVWSKKFAQTSSLPISASAFAPDGSLYLVTESADPTDFGGGSLSGTRFIVKFDDAGNHVWSKGFPNFSNYRIAAADNGDVVATGLFTGTIDFGGPSALDAGGSSRHFVVRYGPSGGYLAQRLLPDTGGPNDAAEVYAVGDSVFIASAFSGTINFGLGTLDAGNSYNCFVLKLDANLGNVWNDDYGAEAQETDRGPHLAFATNGDILLAFRTDLQNSPLPAPQSTVMRMDANRNLIWSRSFDGLYVVDRVGVTAEDEVILVGSATESVNFGGGDLPSGGDWDVVVATLSGTSGDHVASVRIGGAGYEVGSRAQIDAHGDIVLAGVVPDGNETDLGDGLWTGDADGNGYLVKLTGDGSVRWSQFFDGPGRQSPYSLAIATDGRIAVAGGFHNALTLGGVTLTTSAGDNHLFVGVLEP